jgi:hypothetical protein
MGNNNLNGNNENLYIRLDQNNIICVDPNSITDENNVVGPRNVQPENLVMFVNLEADLIPRTVLSLSDAKSQQGRLTSIASGNLNFLKNQKGRDFDTSWSDYFTPVSTTTEINTNSNSSMFTKSNDDVSGQSFGIESVTLGVKAMGLPVVTINFIDVRGKTLMGAEKNSPYASFFHLPWPIFYLTIKGFYGKAIKYRLHMTSFTSKYNDSNGNFEITCSFVGQTYAYLTEIPLNGIMAAPYLYYIETTKDVQTNTKNNVIEKRISKSSKGYSMLTSVYNDYKAKNLIPKDFPVVTLRELIYKAKSLDKILEKEIFSNAVDYKLFGGLKELEQKVESYINTVSAWKSTNLSADYYIDPLEKGSETKTRWYYLSDKDKQSTKKLLDNKTPGTLEFILNFYNTEIEKIKNYIRNHNKESNNDIFKKINVDLINNIKDVSQYYIKLGNEYNYSVVTNIVGLQKEILKVQSSLKEQREKIENQIEKRANTIIKDKTKGIGFDPTLRNVFAVILANADVYIKFLKDVHNKSFDAGEERKKRLTKEYHDETPKQNAIYPWPKITRPNPENGQNELAYPGSADLIEILSSNDKTLWPEVDFVENYISIVTKKEDTLADKESGVGRVNFLFDDVDGTKIKPISSFLNLIIGGLPYTDKTISSILYEIYERGRYETLFNVHNDKVVLEFADREFDNIQASFDEDYDIIEVLKKVNNLSKLETYLYSFSPYEKYPYYKDSLPTTPSIKYLLETPFDISAYYTSVNKLDLLSEYPELSKEITNYKSEDYRKNLYPYNSSTYLSYINKTTFDSNELTFTSVFDVNTKEGLIKSPINSKMWVKDDYLTNIFTQKLEITSDSVNILNTPYFHKQLYKDYTNGISKGKYAGSAYLLLNSLPFYDLEDEVNVGLGSTRLSNMFKEIGASHYVPYHLILKWGSIYHRYKKFLLEGVDILSGATTLISGNTFFDNNSGTTFTNAQLSVIYGLFPYFGTYTGSSYNGLDIGTHPFYEAVFHQIINDYTFYEVTSGNTSFSATTTNGIYNTRFRKIKDKRYYSSFIDNSKINPDSTYYTILPSDGSNLEDNLNVNDDFYKDEQNNFRVVWYDDEKISNIYSAQTLNSTYEYMRSLDTDERGLDNIFSLRENTTNKRKVIDLIATFSPAILDEFEFYFLDFATSRENVEVAHSSFDSFTDENGNYHNISYQNFQDLLKDIVTVPIDTTKDGDDVTKIINAIRTKQKSKLETITNSILSQNNLLKITLGNPREIDLHVWEGFVGINTNNTFKVEEYNDSQITIEKLRYLKLYLGEEPTSDCYFNFFKDNNVEFSEKNILLFRPLIYLYAGGFKESEFTTPLEFKQYIVTNIIDPFRLRFANYMDRVIWKMNTTGFKVNNNQPNAIDHSGYNNDTLKLELYNYFKSFNDKWASGNSIGQHGLLEEFLFLDRANRDIGDLAYLDITKLIDLENPANDGLDLYSVISSLLGDDSNFQMMAMPAYVNFYGTNFVGSKPKLMSSKKAASSVFGSFLEVDYQESSPKILIQYINSISKNVDMEGINDDYLYKDDSFDVGSKTNNSLVITNPEIFDPANLKKANKVVAFDVSIGDQNQGLFKGIQISQDTIKNTSESFRVWENIGRSSTGAAATQIDSNLYDVYRQASYTCEITMLGDVMIQPTMFFYLKNVPIFTGTYWIMEVNHSVRGSKMTTTFKGVRIPKESLPTFEDAFTSSYRSLFDKIIKESLKQFKQETEPQPTTEQSVTSNTKSGTIDQGTTKSDPNEKLISDVSTTEFGISYNGNNGEKYIQYVDYNGIKWLKAKAVIMGSKDYPIGDKIEMQILNNVTTIKISGSTETPDKILWKDIKRKDIFYYSTRFNLKEILANNIIKGKTTFYNPKEKLTVEINPITEINVNNIPSIKGPVNVGPSLKGTSKEYGVGLSESLARTLKVNNGDFIYFNLSY